MRLLLAWSHDKQSQMLVTLKPALGFAKVTSSNPLTSGGGTSSMMHPSQTTATDDTEATGLENYRPKKGGRPEQFPCNKYQSCFSEDASMGGLQVALEWNLMALEDKEHVRAIIGSHMNSQYTMARNILEKHAILVKIQGEYVEISNRRDPNLFMDYLTMGGAKTMPQLDVVVKNGSPPLELPFDRGKPFVNEGRRRKMVDGIAGRKGM